MPLENFMVQAVEPTRGKGFKVKTGSETLFVFDAAAANACKLAIGTVVTGDVTRKENKNGDVFPTIQSVHGAATGDPSPAAAAPASVLGPTVPVAPAPSAVPRGGGGNSFKKDPLGVVLGSRQTALNAAVAYCTQNPQDDPALVLDTAAGFNEFLLRGLGKRLTEDGMTVAEVFPWRQ